MVVDEQELWPTWTYLSAPAQHVDKVHVTFRIFGTAKTSREQWVAERRSRAPEISCAFYHLLERCVKAGPLSERSVRNGRRVER
ncbi:hypothetical protein ASPWEDRAFT_41491 [Aspergillus wentii DTO 134E9]|uniref:Uncharacterized protein n=1 Tax=Aspergillus wentii DTO 134E9 TaxID=1073089 RepID=A0A1L9RFE4_ASPWE|nr:uncharacterized protein ASPWEDRAFT_41491 [Aspergillus wentii DTO 134E9]OJJ33642.1 hypothetical protein ASPWEDRAFT_41491 [Aspergillus wentii DTO 134E9]